MQTILMAADHGGANLKNTLKVYLQQKGFEIIDYGPENADVLLDFPDKAMELVQGMKADPTAKGILVCTSGIGMSMAANRYPFIRGALVFNTEMAKMSREHNNANVLVFGAKFIDPEEAQKCVDIFLTTEFLGSTCERYERRLKKLTAMGGEK